MKITSSQYHVHFIILLISVFLLMSPKAQATETMDEERTNDYATAFWNSFNTDLSAGNLEVYLDHWDENAERITPTVHAKGKMEIRATYESYLAAYSDFHQTELRRIVDGNVVVSELLTRARDKVSGAVLSLPNVAIVEFNEAGKVIRARVYLDTRKFNPQPQHK
jgi:ketosteroid isomerase-like protein